MITRFTLLFLFASVALVGQPPGRNVDNPAPASSTDQTGTLQDFINARQKIPAGNFTFSGQLIVPPGYDMEGSGVRATYLNYNGVPRSDGCIIIGAGSWGYNLGKFCLTNTNKANSKKGVGLGAGTDTSQPAQGNQSNAGLWQSVAVYGFGTGVLLGAGGGRAVSEMNFANIQVSQCDVGILCNDWNTLNLVFHMPMLSFCRVGLSCTQACSVHVFGGSAGKCSEAVFRFSQGGCYSVRGVRVESSKRLAYCCDTSAATIVSIEDCQTTWVMERDDNIDIEFNSGGALNVASCLLIGKIHYVYGDDKRYPLGFGSICLTNVKTFYNVLLDGPKGSKCQYDIRGCALLDKKGSPIAVIGPIAGVIGQGPIPEKTVPTPNR